MREARLPVIVEARAWCRVDLAGGTLDIWPLGLLHAGARTVNLAIDRAATVRLRALSEQSGDGISYRVLQGDTKSVGPLAQLSADPATALIARVCEYLELPAVEVTIESQSPRGGGLGASSAVTVALLRGGERLVGRAPLADDQLVQVARDLEARLMSLPTGVQDYFPALHGGVLEIEYRTGETPVRPISNGAALSPHLVVAYSGQSHFSAGNNWQVVRRRLEGDGEVCRQLDGIADVAQRMAVAVRAADPELAGRLMSEEWSFRRRLAPEIETARVAELLGLGTASGAWGGKVCGAGGGGCLAWLVPRERRDEVCRSLTAAGAEVLDIVVAEGGVRVRSSPELVS